MENDLFEWFWSLHPVATGLLIALLGPFAIWLIEIRRSRQNPRRKVPHGMNILRWTSVWAGDLVFISFAVAILTIWYDRVEVDSSFWTSTSFSVLTLLTSLLVVALFTSMESVTDVWRGDTFNLNRTWHTLYMTFVMALMLGATRVIFYGVIQGHERGLAVAALVMVGLYFVTIAIDMLDLNPLWRLLKKRYPMGKTLYP